MINPVIAVFSMVTTKDIYFAGFLILFIIEIVKLIENPSTYLKSPFNWIKYILFGVLACLFRNNAIYAIILSVPFFVISLRKYWKKVLIIIIVFLCVYYGISDFVYAKLGVKDGKPQEMLSVPIQQISSVSAYHDNEISNDEKNEIDKFLSYKDVKRIYNPRFTDVCKDTFKSKYYKQHKNEFFELWIKLFKKYPSDYVTAFLTLNIPYWYINANSVDAYSKRKYIEDNMIKTDYYTKERESKLPKLYEFYGKVTSFELFEKKPLISNIFSLSTPIWLLLFTMFTLIYKKQIKVINVILPIIFLWLTYIAGPVSNFRYIFPIVCLYPLLIALIINSSKFNQ